MNAADLHRKATDEFARRVAGIKDDQWANATPCTEWDVRALVNHLVGEQVWIEPLVTEGLTVPQVGDRFSGDLLGSDPKAAWESAAKSAVTSFSAPGAMVKTIHLSSRDVPGERYAQEVLCDLIVHSWDLAKGIEANDEIDAELVDAAWKLGVPMLQEWRTLEGIEASFAPPIDTPDGADLQTQLLAYYGRRRDWKP
ncbi:MAG: TIGR03086 family metal-binding protein [Actinomycetota bacterium]|nr:TIGR03086 family protein [Actinomycetota bacterium]